MDVDCGADFAENLELGRVRAAGSYATSMMVCLPSSMSAEGAHGFGTMGLPAPAMERLARDADFSHFRTVKADGRWALYEARI